MKTTKGMSTTEKQTELIRLTGEKHASLKRLARLGAEELVAQYAPQLNVEQTKTLKTLALAVFTQKPVTVEMLKAFLDATPNITAIFGPREGSA